MKPIKMLQPWSDFHQESTKKTFLPAKKEMYKYASELLGYEIEPQDFSEADVDYLIKAHLQNFLVGAKVAFKFEGELVTGKIVSDVKVRKGSLAADVVLNGKIVVIFVKNMEAL